MGFLPVLSQLLGLVYLGCWSFCNVPQFILNWRRQSVKGFSITFQALNMVGFLNYLIFLVYGYQYQHRHAGSIKSIVWQDFMWCGITLVFVYLTAIQVVLYRKTISESIHPFYQFSIFGIIIISLYNLALSLNGWLPWWSEAEGFKAYSFMHFLGYSKTYVSFVKYLPQVMLNFRLKNTHGFSIIAVLMDITGALSSFFQSFVNAYIDGEKGGKGPDFSTIFGNLPKFLLSIESIIFCGILTFQHYVLYAKENERIRLQEDATHKKEKNNIDGDNDNDMNDIDDDDNGDSTSFEDQQTTTEKTSLLQVNGDQSEIHFETI